MLSAYVLILTEIGKVAHVARALNELDGVESRRGPRRPLRRHRQGPGARSGSAAGWWPPASRPWMASPEPLPAQ